MRGAIVKRKNLFLLPIFLIVLIALTCPVLAQSVESAAAPWTTYRDFHAMEGETIVITLDLPGVLVSHDDLFHPLEEKAEGSGSTARRVFRFAAPREGEGAILFQLIDQKGDLAGRMEYTVTVGRGERERVENPPVVTEKKPKREGNTGGDRDDLDAVLVEAKIKNPTEPISPEMLEALGKPGPAGMRREIISALPASPAEINQYELASELFTRRYYDQAANEYRRLIQTFPNSSLAPLAQFKVGEAYHEEAKESLLEAENLQARRLSGRVSERLDQADSEYAAAAHEFLRVIALYPSSGLTDDAELYYAASLHGQAKVAFRQGQTDEFPGVVREYLRTVLTDPAGPLADEAVLGIAEYHRDRADAMIEAGLAGLEVRRVYQKAIDSYQRVASEYPLSSSADDALFALGRIYDQNLEMRDFEEASRYYESVVSTYPQSPYAAPARERADFIRANYL